jgi:stage V sporulation protein B
VARLAGRGTVYITAAKVWFIASGFGIELILTRLMTLEQFGIYKVVIGVVSIINAVVIAGTYQTVSKYISQEPGKADSVKRKSLGLQLLVGGSITIGFFLLAPLTARYLNDERLTDYLRIASFITLSYSFYAVFTGYFNGQKKFLAQAALDMTYSTLKLVCIVALVWIGLGVAGAVGGFAIAAAVILTISAIAAKGGSRTGEVKASELFRFQSYLLIFTLVLNLLQKVDLILIKSLSSTDATVASENAGYYGAAINLANITYQIIISATFVIFPLISEVTFANDRASTRAYVTNTLRYSVMIMAPVATLFSANAAEAIRVVYPTNYQAGGAALGVVAFGMLLFGALHVMTAIISASGHPKVSLAVGAVTLATSAALNYLLIPKLGITGAAIGTTAAMFVGAAAGGGYVLAKFGALMPLKSILRIALGAGAIYGASLVFTPDSKVLILAEMVALGLVYFVALVLTGELGRDDLGAVKKVLKARAEK